MKPTNSNTPSNLPGVQPYAQYAYPQVYSQNGVPQQVPQPVYYYAPQAVRHPAPNMQRINPYEKVDEPVVQNEQSSSAPVVSTPVVHQDNIQPEVTSEATLAEGDVEQQPQRRCRCRFKKCGKKFFVGFTILSLFLYFTFTPRSIAWFTPFTTILFALGGSKLIKKKLGFLGETNVKFIKSTYIATIIVTNLAILNLSMMSFPFFIYPLALAVLILGIKAMKTYKFYNHKFGIHALLFVIGMFLVYFTVVYHCRCITNFQPYSHNYHHKKDERYGGRQKMEHHGRHSAKAAQVAVAAVTCVACPVIRLVIPGALLLVWGIFLGIHYHFHKKSRTVSANTSL